MKKRTSTTCPVVFTVDILGDNWTLVILRDLLLNGKSHFREFLASDEKIASNILSNRLEGMIAAGLITKQADERNKSAAIYRPTQKTLDLLPMLFELIKWGVKYNPNIDLSDPGLQLLLRDQDTLHRQVLAQFET
ncbi:MAG TPA: helix-turn-helix domain-containing protein [Candidatus Saccharimonadales bacterium]|nr:helix-turn-helix domain-containing protein [Candidatus Saccharimonadales bacterium]